MAKDDRRDESENADAYAGQQCLSHLCVIERRETAAGRVWPDLIEGPGSSRTRPPQYG